MNIDWMWIIKSISLFTYLVFYFFITKWMSKYILEHKDFKELVLNNYKKAFSDNLLRNSTFFILCVIGICIACILLSALFAILTGGILGINLAILTLFISIPYGVYYLIKSICIVNNQVSEK